MTHLLYEYLSRQLEKRLKDRKIVVVYDPLSEYLPFFDRELEVSSSEAEALSKVTLGEVTTYFARYDGSFFSLRAAAEPIFAVDDPEPLLLYLPGVQHEPKRSILMELETAGECYTPRRLRTAARDVLRKLFTEGQIDEMLPHEGVTYDDVVSFLEQGADGRTASILRSLYGPIRNEILLADWLANDGQDNAIEKRQARGELYKLIETQLGFALSEDTPISEARDKTVRYVLINEFRSDLDCEPPASVALIPSASTKDHRSRLRLVASTLRETYGDRYVILADVVEEDLNLRGAGIDAGHLGSIDTFRFEERSLLGYAGELIVEKRYAEALAIVTERRRSFWADRDVTRQVQWEACRLMAELSLAIERVRPALRKAGDAASKWVDSYASEDGGWYEVDLLQRTLETQVAFMDDDPESERALALVRREHEDLLRDMATGLSTALEASGWTVPGVLHQTRVYPDVVEPTGGPTAYFLVDALRYEMGVELSRQLAEAEELTLRPAVAALPTITPVGMAALLPRASASFSVVEHEGKLAAWIEGTPMPSLKERSKFLKARVPDVVEMKLGAVLSDRASKLAKRLGDASLVVVRSQEIDFVGEMDGELLARQVMGTVIGNIARAVKKLGKAGVESFVVTADHGHQFSIRKEEDMRTDKPGGDTVGLHRRCWAGHGGTTPAGTVRVHGADLGYDTDLDFVFPTGLGVFKAGGGLCYHHGSVSLQELVVPVLSLRLLPRQVEEPAVKPVHLAGLPAQIVNRIFVVRVWTERDLFSEEARAFRVILLSEKGEQVGQIGMVTDAEFDPTTGLLSVSPAAEVNVAMRLTSEDCEQVRVVVLDPASDAVLEQSEPIPVKLGI